MVHVCRNLACKDGFIHNDSKGNNAFCGKCFTPTCEKKGCTKPRVNNITLSYHFCIQHRFRPCGYGSCKVTTQSPACPQHTCKVCSDVAKYDDGLCSKHTRRKCLRCGGANDVSEDCSFCRDCACKYGKFVCNSPPIADCVYCVKHLCTYSGCKMSVVDSGFRLCGVHKCEVKECSRLKLSRDCLTCKEHKCLLCNKAITSGFGCDDHQQCCANKDCIRNVSKPGAYYCTLHSCKNGAELGCLNGNDCMEHRCMKCASPKDSVFKYCLKCKCLNPGCNEYGMYGDYCYECYVSTTVSVTLVVA